MKNNETHNNGYQNIYVYEQEINTYPWSQCLVETGIGNYQNKNNVLEEISATPVD